MNSKIYDLLSGEKARWWSSADAAKQGFYGEKIILKLKFAAIPLDTVAFIVQSVPQVKVEMALEDDENNVIERVEVHNKTYRSMEQVKNEENMRIGVKLNLRSNHMVFNKCYITLINPYY